MENMEEHKEKVVPKIKKTKPVCQFCNKKLKLFEQFKCNCDNYFCPKHMNRHSHNCTFDMKSHQKEEIEKNNPKIVKKMVLAF